MDKTDRRYIEPKILSKLINYLGDVMFILLGGSHLTKTEDEESDRDFIALVNNKPKLDYFQFMVQIPSDDEHHSTMFVETLEDFYSTDSDVYVKPLLLHIKNARREEFIYENPKYKNIIDKLFEDIPALSYNAAIRALVNQEALVETLLERYTYAKWHYHLFFAYGIVTGQEIDNELLRDMKRGRNEEACKAYLKKIYDWIISYKNNQQEI